jgi:hypothetical protein
LHYTLTGEVALKSLLIIYFSLFIIGCGAENSDSTNTNTNTNTVLTLTKPSNFQVTELNRELRLSWDTVQGASNYNLYMARESFSGIDLSNYSSLDGGFLRIGAQSGLTLPIQKNGVRYYMLVTANTNEQEGPPSEEITGTAQNEKLAKIDMAGNEVVPYADEWFCVKDKTTGLIWEVKNGINLLDNKNNTYTWYDPDSTDGNTGVQNGGNCTGSLCDTNSYVDAINQLASPFCGSRNWRLPSADELIAMHPDFIRKNQNFNRFVYMLDDGYWKFMDDFLNLWSSTINVSNNLEAVYLVRNTGTLSSLKADPKKVLLVHE